MTDLDARIREGLAEAVRPLPARSVDELAVQLSAARRRSTGSRRRTAIVAAAAAAVVVLVGALVWVARVQGTTDDLHVVPGTAPAPSATPEPTPTTAGTVAPVGPSGFAAWGPGWHDIDAGPVDRAWARAVWAGDRLVVVGTRGWSYSPVDRAWAEIPVPEGIAGPELVWTGTEVVAVGTGAGGEARSATWRPGADRWVDAGSVPTAPGLVAVGGTGPRSSGGPALLWTGSRAFYGPKLAMFDPLSRRWSSLPLPTELVRYFGVLTVNPVVSGGDVVLRPADSRSSGLAWDADGTSFHDVAPVDAQQVVPLDPPNLIPDTMAVAAEDSLVLLTNEDGYAVARDGSGTWHRVDPIPGHDDGTSCYYGGVAVVGGRVLVRACAGDQLAWLAGTTWDLVAQRAGGVPRGQFVSTGDALVVMDASADGSPVFDLHVWVP